MELKNIIYEKNLGIATITLNRPEKRNAFSVSMRQEFAECLKDASKDDDIRVIVLTGKDPAFCSGGDLARISESYQERKVKFSFPEKPSQTPRLLQILEKPTIAAVNGDAAGAGFDLALMCDIRIAGERARFAETYVSRGMVPAGGSYLLPRLVGLQKACHLIFSGEWIDAKEAERIGLVLKAVPSEQLLHEADQLAAKICKQAKYAVQLSKKVIYRGLTTDFDTHLEFVGYVRAVAARSGETEEGIGAFLEKRKARFEP
ncbi:MAG: enoyl-CoA hydratase/isomerase family protein [Deltaproteobacteria bacterium]|nr:enoyl-CoA hydratase/isomerase family protein [Deltaproteobacteria bacterium]